MINYNFIGFGKLPKGIISEFNSPYKYSHYELYKNGRVINVDLPAKSTWTIDEYCKRFFKDI